MENMFYLVTHYLASPFVMLCHIFFFFLKILFIYLREREQERARAGGGAEGEREARLPAQCGAL